MGYVGAKLEEWFNKPDIIARHLHAGADSLGEFQTKTTIQNTPIDEGWLRSQIRQKITVVTVGASGRLQYATGSETNVEYAPFVEHGTGLWGPRHARYEIRPRNPNGWLRWIDPRTGNPVFARRVMHPGSPGNHMFAIGVALTEHAFEAILEPHTRSMMRDLERAIHRHRTVSRRRI